MTELIKPLPSYLDKESRKPEATDVIREGNRAAQAAIISEAQRRGDDIEYYITADEREFSKIDDKYVVSFWKALLTSNTFGMLCFFLGLAVFAVVFAGLMMLAIPPKDGVTSLLMILLAGLTLAAGVTGIINLVFDFKVLAYVKKHGYTDYYLDNLRASAQTLIGVGGKGLYFVTNPWTDEQLKVNLCHYDALDKVRVGGNLVLISRDGGPAYVQDSYEAWGEGHHKGGLESDLNRRIEMARTK